MYCSLLILSHITLCMFLVTPKSEFGVHGYDDEFSDMRPFFIAYGPRIKKSHKVPPFSTLDLYNLFCEILEIQPESNNGTYANICDILTHFKKVPQSSFAIAGMYINVRFYSLFETKKVPLKS